MSKILLVIFFLISITACMEKSTPVPQKVTEPVKKEMEKPAELESNSDSEAKFKEPKIPTIDINKKYSAVIETEKGNIELELYAQDAPISVSNFVQLAEGGFYEGLTFHRVEPGFVVQGGDPLGNGTGGPGYTIVPEIKHEHIEGALAWARTGDQVNPERRSSGSQFYITLAATPFLDGAYTVFGKTTKGMDVVKKISRGDKIISIKVTAQ